MNSTGFTKNVSVPTRKAFIRLTSLIVAAVMLLVMVPVQTVTASQYDVYYTIEDGEVTITGWGYGDSNLVIPAVIEGYPVTKIRGSAFRSTSITSVTIPGSVNTIGSYAFSHCSSLTTVTIEEGVSVIEDAAFEYCSKLETITLPSTLTKLQANSVFYGCSSLGYTQYDYAQYLGNAENPYLVCMKPTEQGKRAYSIILHPQTKVIAGAAFVDCNRLSYINIPDGVIAILSGAFRYAQVSNIYIPSSVSYLGDNIFPATTLYNVDANNTAYGSTSQGALYNKQSKTLLQVPVSIKGEFIVPDGITTIGYEAFYECNQITSVQLSNDITTIEDRAFYYCSSINSVIIGDGVTAIGDSAFKNCYALTNLTLGKNVVRIGADTFNGCSGLSAVSIPATTTFIGENAFNRMIFTVDPANPAYCSDEAGVLYNKDKTVLIQGNSSVSGTYVIPDGVTTIGAYMFSDCTGLNGVVIPESVTTIEPWAFSGCINLTQVDMTNYHVAIGRGAFSNTSAGTTDGDTYYLGNGNNPYFMLYYCGDTWREDVYTVHPDTRLIGIDAFQDSYSWLEEVVLPEGLTFIGQKAFYQSGLSVNLPSTIITIGDHAFSGCRINAEALPQGLTSILEGTFMNCYFSGGIENMDIPEGVTTIGKEAFYSCDSLTEVMIPEGVTSIGESAFKDCYALSKVSIPDSVTFIGLDAFLYCDSLNVNHVGYNMYLGNENTPDIVLIRGDSANPISENTVAIHNAAYYENISLTEITIPKKVKSIGYNTFYGCVNLKTITFQGDAPVIDPFALGFYKEADDAVATVYYPANNPTWTEEVMNSVVGEITWVPYDAGETQGNNITGSISAAANATGLRVELWKDSNSNSPAYTATVTDGTYTFENVENGNYRLVVYMDNGVTREYEVSLNGSDAVVDTKICQKGDVSGDGKINVSDTGRLYGYIKGTAELTGYALECADVNGDGKINVADTSKIYAHIRGTKPLF